MSKVHDRGAPGRLQDPSRWSRAARPLAVALVTFSVSAASAQQKSAEVDPFAGVEEMVVTGSSTADLLNPSSTAAIAFDSAALADIGVADVSDLASYVPNLEITTVNATNASFFIRGVGLQDFGANASSSVPIFQDGIPRNASATQLVGLFDIGGLSVLKGPQGSGNRRNASAGAFIVQTNLPEPEFSGTARVTLAQLNSSQARDATRYAFETAMNAPIYEDIVSARLAARYSHENPFWENRCANRVPLDQRPAAPAAGNQICGEFVRSGARSLVNPFLSRYLGEVDDFGFRGTVRVVPPDSPLELVMRVETSRLNRDSTNGQAVGTGQGFLGQGGQLGYRDPDLTRENEAIIARLRAEDPSLTLIQARNLARPILAKRVRKRPLDREPFKGNLNQPGRTILGTHSFSTTATVENDFATTTLNLGFLDYRRSEFRDTDLTPNQRFDGNDNDQAWQLYGDLSVEGEAIGEIPITWSTGLFSIYEKLEGQTKQSVVGGLQGGGPLVDREIEQVIDGWGVYGEAAYDLAEAFTLSAGFRYNWERKDFAVRSKTQNNIAQIGLPPILVPQRERSANQRTWDGFTGFVNIEYRFTEDISSYVKFTRGFKAGHFNPSNPLTAKVPGSGFVDPESIDSIEVGFSGSAWSDRIRGNANFFFYNYRDLQVFRVTQSIRGFAREVQSAEQARNMGIEAEISLKPLEGFVPEAIEGLEISLLGAWLEAKFVEFSVLEPRLIGSNTLGIPIDFSGNTLLNSPQLSLTGRFTWPVDLDRFGRFTPQYDFTWTDDVPFDPNNGKGEPDVFGNNRFPAFTIGARAYMLHNVRLTWTPPDDPGFELSGWCRNVEDRRYKTFGVDLSGIELLQLHYVGEPRVCGADFRFRW